jgi:S1-C subfamily serine protease
MATTSLSCIRVGRFVASLMLTLFVGLFSCAAQGNSPQNSSGAVSGPAAPGYRMVRATAGTKGVEQNGQFFMTDPRTIFHLSDDHKVIVEFEWDGPLGPHKFEGLWKDPNGKVAIVSDFQFEPKTSPFAGYFTMLIDESATTGIWTIDSRIDGQTAGSYSFQIVAGAGTTPVPTARIPLTPTDIYQKAQLATAFVEKIDSSGKEFGRGSGFSLGSGRLLTAFGNIDGASELRLVFSGGQTIAASRVIAWNRLQDWAVLRVDAPGIPDLKLAQAKSWSVGQRVYSLGTSPAGGRTIINGGIVGDTSQPDAGERLTMSFAFNALSVGSPILDDFGDVVGMLGGLLLPDAGDSPSSGIPPSGGFVSFAAALAVPTDIIRFPPPDQPSATLADFAAKGLFIAPVTAQDQVGYGALALGLDNKGQGAWPRDTRDLFSHSDGKMMVFINWMPKTKFKGVATLRFFDVNNKELAQSQPSNVNIHPGQFTSTSWTVPLASFASGTYRADIYLGDAPAWREFFRVLP